MGVITVKNCTIILFLLFSALSLVFYFVISDDTDKKTLMIDAIFSFSMALMMYFFYPKKDSENFTPYYYNDSIIEIF